MEQSEIMRDMDSSQQIDSYIPHKNFVCRGYNKHKSLVWLITGKSHQL